MRKRILKRVGDYVLAVGGLMVVTALAAVAMYMPGPWQWRVVVSVLTAVLGAVVTVEVAIRAILATPPRHGADAPTYPEDNPTETLR